MAKKLKFWFAQEALEKSKEQVYNRTTNTVDMDETKLKAKTDIFAVFGDHATEADRLNAEMTGAVIPVYHGGFDSDTDSDDEDEPRPKPKFDLKMLFNLKPSLSGAGGMDDQNSIGTNATGTSNVTQLLLAGGINARFDSINLDGDSVISSLTGQTKHTPPPQPRQLTAILNENEEDDKMDQEEQKEGEDKMELDKDDTKKDNEEKNQTDPDESMVNGDSQNEHERENRQKNGNNDDIEDGREESKKESNDKGGGGRGGGRGMGSGRGRGRFNLNIQEDTGGRGGNRRQGTKGSDIDTSHNKITKIVVHQTDNIAQPGGENEQTPTANGKSDNVSTSPQQTGAEEYTAG